MQFFTHVLRLELWLIWCDAQARTTEKLPKCPAARSAIIAQWDCTLAIPGGTATEKVGA
jgi:hypothetical protein